MLEDPHLFIPVLQDNMPDPNSLRQMNPTQRHLVTHIDGQISLAALSVYLSLPMDQVVEDIKHLLFLQVIRICRIPPDASMALPALLGMPHHQAAEATKAWTHDQAQHKKSWSQTERALVAVAIQQNTRSEIPAVQRQHPQSPQERIAQRLQQHAPGASINMAGVYPVVENWMDEDPQDCAVEQTKDFPTPMLRPTTHTPFPNLSSVSARSSIPTPWQRTAIQESLDDLEQWEQESNPGHDPLPTVLGQETSDSYAASEEDREVYQAISYYDLPTFGNEPLQKPGKSLASQPELPSTSTSNELRRPYPPIPTPMPKKSPDLSIHVAPTLLGTPPVPQFKTLEEFPTTHHAQLHPSVPSGLSAPSVPPMPRAVVQDSGDHFLSIEPSKPRIMVKRGNTSEDDQPQALSSVIATLPNIPRLATVLDIPKIPNKKDPS